MRNSSILLLLLLFCAVVRAQTPIRNYLITQSGDTITAKIRHNMMGKMVYKTSADSASHLIDTNNIKSYYWTGKKPFYFLVLQLPDIKKKTFVGVLEQGKINLYERKVYSARSSTSYWYAAKGTQLFEINSSTRLFGFDRKLKHNFETLIDDNAKVSAELKSQKRYNLKVIRQIIKEYNSPEG